MIGSIVLNTAWLSGKETTCNAGATGNMGSICGSGRSPRKGNYNILQYSCLKNPMDRGTLQAIVQKLQSQSDTTEQLSTNT